MLSRTFASRIAAGPAPLPITVRYVCVVFGVSGPGYYGAARAVLGAEAGGNSGRKRKA
jgi:hypothetical protein